MSDKYIIDEEGEYVIDTETNDMWDATGGGDGIYMLVKKVNKLLEENKQLKKRIKELKEENASMKGRIINAMVKSNQVECNCTTCVCEDYVHEELKKW